MVSNNLQILTGDLVIRYYKMILFFDITTNPCPICYSWWDETG